MTDPEVINTEVIPTQALAVRPTSALPTVQDLEQQFELAVRQRELLSQYIKKQLVPGKHFYQRGTQKPSLAKEGAEIILLPHNLAPDYEQTGGPDAPPPDGRPYQITAKCILRRKGDPTSFVGSGIGSAGSEKLTKEGKYVPRQTDKYLCHNATLKMAQKSAMIAATINSTAASEFFTQDMDEPGQPDPEPQAPIRKPTPPPAPKTVTSPKFATEKTREWFIKEIGDAREHATGFLIDLGWIMPNETLEDMPLRWIPVSKAQVESFKQHMGGWIQEGRAEKPYSANPEAPLTDEPKAPTKPKVAAADDEAWRDFIVPIPPKGVSKAQYLKSPMTIGMMFDMRHGQDEESQATRQRLWGFVNHFSPKPWTGKDGKERPPSDTDVKFREALDQFRAWFEANHPDEKL